ncbi:FecR family protein [Geofilum rubicundum]|uniref:Putative anti-sigma factor n=1 Tax=Geofilum rubicundum JCM 15548 TaxID=1236989 RepID=A0A0E9LRH8_9BACT|nr:FecR family protein [Geofilum rubicundum]GAO27756.1 putative anti-sigma factor [Geofilum rubicundum JCM 15548]
MNNEDKIKKWLAGELSESETSDFESTEEFAKIDKLMKAVNTFKAPGYDVLNEYSKLSDNVLHSKRTISLFERMKPVLKIAAIFIVALTIGYFSFNQINSTSENQGWIAEQSEVYLPDSSFVAINSGSKIKFSEKKWSKERNVELNGEAFFKVKKGSQFNVITEQGMVTVLGTEFDVKARENYYEVTCYSGLVRVKTEQSEVVLKPKSVYRVIEGTEQQYTISDKATPSWLQGESNFKSVPFSFVIKELERQYQIKVETGNTDINQLFSGSFSHNNLSIALESITIPLNLYYEINENKIVIGLEE